MSTSPHISKPLSSNGRPSEITLDNLYEYIESFDRWREERETKLKIQLTTLLEKNHKLLENRIISLENELQGMSGRIQEIEHIKEPMIEENNSLKSNIKILKEQLNNNLALNKTNSKLDIKPIK